MSFFGLFDHLRQGPRAPVRGPLRSKREFVAYVHSVVGDQQLAELLGEVVERIGRDGYIDVQQGGKGNPYHVEYQTDPSMAQVPTRDINRRIEELKKTLRQTASEGEQAQLRRSIAELAGGMAVIWINVPSAEFEQKRQRLMHGYSSARQAAGMR